MLAYHPFTKNYNLLISNISLVNNSKGSFQQAAQ